MTVFCAERNGESRAEASMVIHLQGLGGSRVEAGEMLPQVSFFEYGSDF